MDLYIGPLLILVAEHGGCYLGSGELVVAEHWGCYEKKMDHAKARHSFRRSPLVFGAAGSAFGFGLAFSLALAFLPAGTDPLSGTLCKAKASSGDGSAGAAAAAGVAAAPSAIESDALVVEDASNPITAFGVAATEVSAVLDTVTRSRSVLV